MWIKRCLFMSVPFSLLATTGAAQTLSHPKLEALIRRMDAAEAARLLFAKLVFLWLVAGACGDRPEPPHRAEIRTPADSATEAIVQAQVDAYNRRDLDAFLKHFSQDAKLYTFPDTLLFAGVDTLRAVYGQLFADASQLKAEVTRRVIQGRFVIDREITSGMPGHGTHTGVAIYEVRDGLITRVWFLD